VRGCAKTGCDGRAIATVALSYGPKEVLIGDLTGERDPNLLDLCRSHTDRLSPPLGWKLTDLRSRTEVSG